MKNCLFFIIIAGLCLNSQAFIKETSGQKSDFSSSSDSGQKSLKYNSVSPPEVNMYPDTIDGGGIITIEVTIADDLENFDYGYIFIYKPDGETGYEYYFYNSDLNSGMVTIDCNCNIRNITIYDFKGKVVYSCSADCKRINVGGIEKGIYIKGSHR